MKKSIYILFLSVFYFHGLIFCAEVNSASSDKNSLLTSANQHNKTRVFYKVTKGEEVKGYIFGTIHVGLTGYEAIKSLIKPYVDECTDFFFECNHDEEEWKKLPLGPDRAIFDLLGQRSDVSRFNFEEKSFQELMVMDGFWWGSDLVIPWWHDVGTLESYELVVKILIQKIIPKFIYIKNQYFSDSAKRIEACKKFNNKDKEIGIVICQNYLQEIAVEPNNFTNKRFLLTDRNQEWIGLLRHYSYDKPFFITCGASHLPGEKGMVSLLEEEGFTLEPIVLWNEK